MFLYSSNPRSQGARRLARELGCRRIRHRNSRFKAHRGRRGPHVVNWGASQLPGWSYRLEQMGCILNAPRAVERASNKLAFFHDMRETDLTPKHTQGDKNAQNWLRDGHKVVCRTLLNASGGRGIVIASTVEELINAPLYVQYIPKRAEYRVHVFNGEVIDVQQKVRRRGIEPTNWKIRSHDNGFIFQREMMHDRVVFKARDIAVECMEQTDLLFGAVDVIYNERQDRAYVLEINTAPGLEGQTVLSYARAIREYIRWH